MPRDESSYFSSVGKSSFWLPTVPRLARMLPCLLRARGLQGEEETWDTRGKQCCGSSRPCRVWGSCPGQRASLGQCIFMHAIPLTWVWGAGLRLARGGGWALEAEHTSCLCPVLSLLCFEIWWDCATIWNSCRQITFMIYYCNKIINLWQSEI